MLILEAANKLLFVQEAAAGQSDNNWRLLAALAVLMKNPHQAVH